MKPVVSKKIRNAARGQDCTMQVMTICNHNPETTVLAHVNTAGTGSKGAKCHDFSAVFACHACHTWMDNYKGSGEDRLFYTRRALIRTWEKLIEMGIIKIEGVKP